MMTIALTKKELGSMREWLADCAWANVDPEEITDPELVSDASVVRNVERFYAGGLAGFLLVEGREVPTHG